MKKYCNEHCGCNASSSSLLVTSRRRRSRDEYELSFLDILAAMEHELRFEFYQQKSFEKSFLVKRQALQWSGIDVMSMKVAF